MAVPARKKSKMKSKVRRSANMRRVLMQYSLCENCKQPKISYCICKKCGFYNSKKIINIQK